MTNTLPPARKFIRPQPEDDWDSIASRELPNIAQEEAVSMLQSWNFHVFMRPAAAADSPRAGDPILPSDIIFLEAPIVAPT